MSLYQLNLVAYFCYLELYSPPPSPSVRGSLILKTQNRERARLQASQQ